VDEKLIRKVADGAVQGDVRLPANRSLRGMKKRPQAGETGETACPTKRRDAKAS